MKKVSIVLFLAAITLGCGSSTTVRGDDLVDETGGSAGAADQPAGSSTGSTTGGSEVTGGNVSTGGTGGTVEPTGGTQETGGTLPTGGTQETGGALPTGGVQETGGTLPTGGVSTGGSLPTGGTQETGGANTGGNQETGGESTGGTGGTDPNTGGTGGTCIPKTCLTIAVELDQATRGDLDWLFPDRSLFQNPPDACGVVSDGCGNFIDCGGCSDPFTQCGIGDVYNDSDMNLHIIDWGEGENPVANLCQGGCAYVDNSECPNGTAVVCVTEYNTTPPPYFGPQNYTIVYDRFWCI